MAAPELHNQEKPGTPPEGTGDVPQLQDGNWTPRKDTMTSPQWFSVHLLPPPSPHGGQIRASAGLVLSSHT